MIYIADKTATNALKIHKVLLLLLIKNFFTTY